jgi:hypothetical protein
MASFENDKTVLLIKQRMRQGGIDLDKYIGQITNSWDSVPRGFGFTCKNSAAYNALMQGLVQSRSFGYDSMIGGSQHHGASFREASQPDSLHIILSTRPDPSLSKPGDRLRATCSVHLDSVSVVTAIDENGMVIYDQGKVLQHIATDLLHTPLIVPSTAGGIVFGFRF